MSTSMRIDVALTRQQEPNLSSRIEQFVRPHTDTVDDRTFWARRHVWLHLEQEIGW